MKKLDLNALATAMDTTWGRSSTPKTASFSVKLTMLGPDRVLASYAALATFASEKQMVEQKRRYVEEGKDVTGEVMKHVKESYKSLTGQSLTAKELTSVDSLEVVNMNVHTSKRLGYVRVKSVFEVG